MDNSEKTSSEYLDSSDNLSSSDNPKTINIRMHHLVLFVIELRNCMEEFIKQGLTYEQALEVLTKKLKEKWIDDGYDISSGIVEKMLEIYHQIIKTGVMVKIVDDYTDELCSSGACLQYRGDHCEIRGRKELAYVVKTLDYLIAQETRGAFKIGQIYTSEYILSNLIKYIQPGTKPFLERRFR